MQCSCEVETNIDDANMPSFHDIKTPVARSLHKCGECGRAICPGHRYERAAGVWDGKWEVYKTCADCLSVREQFFNLYLYGGIWEDLQYTIEEWLYEVPESCIAALTPAARSKVCEIIERGWWRNR